MYRPAFTLQDTKLTCYCPLDRWRQ